MRELGLGGMVAMGCQGQVGSAGLAPGLGERLSAALRKVLATLELKARFAAAGSEVQPRGP